jgi:hypothetical protein
MQKVELYDNSLEAQYDMRKHIRDGWRVHVCTMTSCTAGYSTRERVLVVYEKG